MIKLDLYWKSKREWWEFLNHIPVIKENAPKEAQDSYKNYIEQIKELSKNKLFSTSTEEDGIICDVCKKGIYIPLNKESKINHSFTCNKCGARVHFEANVIVE